MALRRSPPFYPDAVTLSRSASADVVLRDIDTSPGCSVKDSFANLDLRPYGFRVLFEAGMDLSARPAPHRRTAWKVVTDPADFGAWETGDAFRPALLDDPGRDLPGG